MIEYAWVHVAFVLCTSSKFSALLGRANKYKGIGKDAQCNQSHRQAFGIKSGLSPLAVVGASSFCR